MNNKEKGRLVKHYSNMSRGDLIKNKSQVSKMGKGYNSLHSEAIKRTLAKAQGGMIGELKRTMKDKDLKKDHYKELGKK